jgi:type IV pilus assembly protein PilC
MPRTSAAAALPTKIVLAMSSFLKGFWWVLLILVAAAAVAFQRFYATENGKRTVDAIMLKIPVLGDVLLKGAVARFTRTLGTLIASGVPILAGLEITARTAGNKIIAEAIMSARASIREGETVSAPLKTSGVFPPMVVQMISVGERPAHWTRCSRRSRCSTRPSGYRGGYTDVDHRAVHDRNHGRIVGGMVVAMYLPMFS